MDEKDIEILWTITDHKTASPAEISEATGIPKSTVHHRIKQLRDREVIKDDLLNIDLEKVGLSMTLISHIWADYDEGYHDTVGEKISNIDGVNKVYFVLGDTDFIAISHIPNREYVERLVSEFESTEEVKRTSSTFVIKTIKDEPSPLNDYPEEGLASRLEDK